MTCENNCHGNGITKRLDGSMKCVKCGFEWPPSKDGGEITAQPTYQVGALPTMDQQEAGMLALFMDPVSISTEDTREEVMAPPRPKKRRREALRVEDEE